MSGHTTLADLPRLDRMLAVATEVVEGYAPNAPDIMHNEAAIRFMWVSRTSRLRNDPVRVCRRA